MARKAVNARRGGEEPHLPPATLARRAAWTALAGTWLFLAVALASFDSADPPSPVVAVQNEPVANLCGAFGATVAYWSYAVVGTGSWLLLAGVAAWLGITVTGRVVGHALVRAVGLLLVAVAVSGLHRLVLPGVGPLAGAPGGLLAELTVHQMLPRFSTVGTFLILLATFGIGAIVAVDRLVLALPAALLRGLRGLGVLRRRGAEGLAALRRRPVPVAAGRGKRGRRLDAAIDPDAGGLGATEAFDPDAHLEDEEEDEEEYEYVDEDGEPVDDDEEYEYEDEDDEACEDEDDEEDDAEAAPPRRRLSAKELREKIARLPVRIGARNQQVARDEDIPRQESFEGYEFPTLDLLEDPETNYTEKMEAFVRRQAEHLEESMQTYGIDGEVVGIESGPTVTLYSVQLAPGTKVAKLNAIASDLARSLRAQNVRIVANMVGKTTVGIEVPNLHKERVRLKELMSGGHAEGMRLPMFLGKDASGEPLVADLTRMPHMLIAGTTGSGKSVCMNTVIVSWLYTKRPDELKLVLVDPKMVELGQFAEIPHLMCPVVTEMGRATAILEWAVNKMEERYELLREAGVRDVTTYNGLGEGELRAIFEPATDEDWARIPKRLPYIVFVIDELADLILTHKEVEQHIVRIAQKARAVGIHLIVATQRPQANVVTGLIKSNMPCRVSFKVASGMDSRIVLDHKGAELLLGQGDMLFLSPHTTELHRSQGTLVTDPEIRRVAKFLKQVAAPSFERSLMAIRPSHADDEEADVDRLAERDPMFDKAVEVMIDSGRGSVSLLQRRLAIGYSRASRLVDQMALAGILGDHKGSVAREVLITMEDWEQMQALEASGDDEDLYADEADDEDEVDVEPLADASEDEGEDDTLDIETLGGRPSPKARAG